MSAPIKVRRCYCPGCEYKPWPKKPTIWDCTICGTGSMGSDKTISEAADAGRNHLTADHPEVVWAAGGAKSTYCRPHGCARTECGCIDPIINAAPQRLARVDMASEYPNSALVALSGAWKARTGDYDPHSTRHTTKDHADDHTQTRGRHLPMRGQARKTRQAARDEQ